MKLELIENSDVRSEIETGLIFRSEARILEDKSEAFKEKGNRLLLGALRQVEGFKVELPLTGSAALVATKRTTFDTAIFKLHLLHKGVSAVLLEEAEKKATSSSESQSVRFSLWKEEAK